MTKTAQRAHWKREGWDWAQALAHRGLSPRQIVAELDPEWPIRDEDLNRQRIAGARAYQAGKPRA